MWNVFKVNNKDTRTTPIAPSWRLYFWLWTYFATCSSVSIVKSEHVFSGWDGNLFSYQSHHLIHRLLFFWKNLVFFLFFLNDKKLWHRHFLHSPSPTLLAISVFFWICEFILQDFCSIKCIKTDISSFLAILDLKFPWHFDFQILTKFLSLDFFTFKTTSNATLMITLSQYFNWHLYSSTLQKMKFPLSISSVNVTKSAGMESWN